MQDKRICSPTFRITNRTIFNELGQEPIVPKNMIRDIAERAYEIYCEGNGDTEYEALEKAIEEYEERR